MVADAATSRNATRDETSTALHTRFQLLRTGATVNQRFRTGECTESPRIHNKPMPAAERMVWIDSCTGRRALGLKSC